jgi:BirA family biotin operon repressor/biotin-[acetyl-CoA-carboxylase] ligase
LYISLLLRPQACTADKALRFTTAAAVSVCEAIEKVYEAAEPAIKWVNDIYMRGRKICGILTEASFNIEDGTLDYAVIGIGINVYTPEGGFPPEISDIAGSVFPAEETSEPVRNRLAAEVLNGLVKHCVLSDADCISEYRKRCMVPGREIDVITHSGTKRAQALGLDDECRLLVRYDDGSEEYLSSGEISIRV